MSGTPRAGVIATTIIIITTKRASATLDRGWRAGEARGSTPIFGVRLCALDRAALVGAITAAPVPPGEGVRLVATMNLDHVVRLQRSAAFRGAYARAWTVTADGAPVMLYARARGAAAPERIAGSDLLVELARAWPRTRRPFFVVGSRSTAAAIVERVQDAGFPEDAVAAVSPPFGFEHDAAASDALVAAIRGHATTDLVFGLGAPKSEVWIDTHRAALGDLYAYGFGSAADFMVGAVRRAPAALRRFGMEWAWRVLQDPARLWRRYFVDSWAVIPAVARDLAGRAPSP